MVFYELSEKAKLRRHRTNEAIALAMQGRWEEAVAVNKSIIDVFPDDADAYNRLGKALTQLGRYAEAREAYGRAVEIEPSNSIARKNLDRLLHLKQDKQTPKNGRQVSSHLFIEETGKAGMADLHNLARSHVLASIAAGDPVELKPRGQSLAVLRTDGEYIGEVEPRLGLRLIKLMQGGNKYAAAVASIAENKGKVMIKETFQHPSQAGRLSFPARAADDFRPYLKDSLVRYDREEDEETPGEDEVGESGKEETLRDDAAYHEEAVGLPDDVEEQDKLEIEEQ